MAATQTLPRPKAYDDTFFKPISIWLTTTDHKLIGIMYMVTGMLSFLLAGIFALIIRLQLSQPNLKVVDADGDGEGEGEGLGIGEGEAGGWSCCCTQLSKSVWSIDSTMICMVEWPTPQSRLQMTG